MPSRRAATSARRSRHLRRGEAAARPGPVPRLAGRLGGRRRLAAGRREAQARRIGPPRGDQREPAGPENVLRTLRTGQVDAVQVVYNIFDQAPEDELFPLCRALGVAVIARVPLDEGSLAGTLTLGSRWPEADWRNSYFGRANLEATIRGSRRSGRWCPRVRRWPSWRSASPLQPGRDHGDPRHAQRRAPRRQPGGLGRRAPARGAGRRAARASLGPSAIARVDVVGARYARTVSDPAGLPHPARWTRAFLACGAIGPSSSGCSARRSPRRGPGTTS